MLSKEDYQDIYQLLAKHTPLPVDCGQLCQQICCKEWSEGVGMYLFPGEEQMFTQDEDWLTWEHHGREDFEMPPTRPDGSWFVTCTKPCPRDQRPLACRIFPMEAYLTEDDQLKIRFNQDAAWICPLVKASDRSLIDRRFLSALRQVYRILMKDPQMLEEIRWHSRKRDKEEQEPWRKLL